MSKLKRIIGCIKSIKRNGFFIEPMVINTRYMSHSDMKAFAEGVKALVEESDIANGRL